MHCVIRLLDRWPSPQRAVRGRCSCPACHRGKLPRLLATPAEGPATVAAGSLLDGARRQELVGLIWGVATGNGGEQVARARRGKSVRRLPRFTALAFSFGSLAAALLGLGRCSSPSPPLADITRLESHIKGARFRSMPLAAPETEGDTDGSSFARLVEPSEIVKLVLD